MSNSSSVTPDKPKDASKPKDAPSSKDGTKVRDGDTEGTGNGGDWFPTRQIDPDAEGHIIQRVSELKSRLSNGALNKSGSNFAYAEVDISGIKKNSMHTVK
ncbi:hypothetical protein [Paenibacillus taichungensis]